MQCWGGRPGPGLRDTGLLCVLHCFHECFLVLCPFGHLEKSIYCNIFSPLMSGFQYPTLKERKKHHVWQIINIALELKCNEKLSALLNVVVLQLPVWLVCL